MIVITCCGLGTEKKIISYVQMLSVPVDFTKTDSGFVISGLLIIWIETKIHPNSASWFSKKIPLNIFHPVFVSSLCQKLIVAQSVSSYGSTINWHHENVSYFIFLLLFQINSQRTTISTAEYNDREGTPFRSFATYVLRWSITGKVLQVKYSIWIAI